jgi:hypothetical protein
MNRLLRVLGLAAGAACVAGCGTFLNMQDRPFPLFWPEGEVPTRRVYGGVAYDAAFGADMLVSSFRPGADFFGPLGFDWGLWVLTVDLPLSAVGDTVTLPWTAWATAERALGVAPAGFTPTYPLARDGELTPASPR